MNQWRLSVFNESPFQGNQAIVQMHDGVLDAEAMVQLARKGGAPATCFVWPCAGGFAAHCFSAIGPIQCCGHGLLAAAYVLHRQRYLSECEFFMLYLGDRLEPLQVELREDKLWLRLPRLMCIETAVPLWARDAFAIQPVRSATAGDESGYLILEYANSVTLSQMDVFHDQITANTSRSVIVTTQATCKDYHFLLRYFAPQYGVDEDAVTGSATRVLADYWGQRMSTRYFRALQCSIGGGVVICRLRPHSVEITGHVTID